MESSSSREILAKLFEQLSEWRKTRKTKKRDPLKFKWSQFHLSVIQGYVLQLNITPDSALLRAATLLNQEFTVEKVASFMHALHEVFVVPHLHQLFVWYYAPKKNELIEAFIYMLLRLLHNTPGSVNSVLDRIFSLWEGLRFLYAVLRDESFIYKIEDLWAEFEEVANKAGRFVHVIFFSTEEDAIDDRFFRNLLRRMDHLEARIIKLANLDKGITEGNKDRTPVAANSISNFSSALYNIEDLVNRVDDSALVKDQIKTLYQKLKFLDSSNSIKQSDTEYAAADVAYEATYLITTFLDGDRDSSHSHSRRYLSIRLSHVIRKINSIKSGIEGSEKNVDNDTVARFSQQNKSNSDPIEVIDLQDKEMATSALEILSKLFEKLSEWRKTKKGDTHKFKWSEFHLSVIHGYVLKLNIALDSSLLKSATLLNKEFTVEKVASFMHALHEVFVVPHHYQLFVRYPAPKKNGLIAAFMDMLLTLLYDTPGGSVNLVVDRIASLWKGMRFLLAVLWDESFIYNIEDLWAEFEEVANKAGRFIHLFIFSTEEHAIDERFFRTLLRRIDHLEAKIIKLANLDKGLNKHRTPAAANSIFTFTSALSDIEGVLNRVDDTADVKDQIKTLHQKLKILESWIKQPDTEHAAADMAYEATYLINTFLDGNRDSPHSYSRRYLSIRLSHVIRKINSIKSGIEGSEKNVDNDTVARFSQLSLQNKSSSDHGEVINHQESSCGEILSKLFKKLSEWRKTKKGDTHKFKWSEFHLSIIHGYVLKLNIAPDSTLVSLAALLNEVGEDLAEHEEKVTSFMHALHEVFAVPQQQQLFERDAAIKKNGVVAAFLDMLLRLLHNRKAPENSMEIRIDSLRKRLRFLVAVLGDEPFITKVEDLWAEFEAVANKAGSAVHLIIFSTKPDPIGKCFFRTLLRCMHPLKDNIIRLSNLEKSISQVNVDRRAAIVDHLFIVDSLLYDIEDILNREDETIADVKDQITTLRQELELLNSLIKNQEIEESKEYVVRIRDVAYEAEYLINYFLDGDGDCHKYLSIRLSHVIHKIKWIKSAIQRSKKNVDNDIPRFLQLSLQTKSSHEATVSEEVIGLEDKEGNILQYLDSEKQDRQIISIVGMPGLGKTTLARKFYHHPSLKHRFDKWSWCVVSQQYDMKSLLIDILGTLTYNLTKEEMLNIPEESLKEMIYQGLYKRRYLIIMDDIWSSDPWCDLNLYFPDNGNGSRILLTSRNKNVVPEESIIYKLPPMSYEHCWQLLRKKVFQNEPCPPQLLKLGRKIAKNCRGLPLAVVVTAGILSSKDTQEESTWKELEGNIASYVLSDESNSIMRIVELSYNNLPEHLKPCFLYFGAYRKRKQIAVGQLLRLWLAEGFVCGEDRKRAESAAEIHLKELINRSLITVLKTSLEGLVKACCVHDLLHEFCMKRCEEENLHTLVDKNYSILYKKHQRFCIRDFVSSPKSPLFGMHVRSILGCFTRSGFLNMKLLRTLVLQGIMCYEGLNEIKDLPNLRCLIIGYGSSPSKLEELKLASISSLINLEFLQVKSQFYLVCTLSEIAKMVKLRHVTVDNEVRFGEESITTSQTNVLEFLSKVIIRELKDEQMLRCSLNLRQLKCKCFPLEEKDKGEPRYPDFSFFTQLESLHVEAGLVCKVTDIYLPLNVKELTLFEIYLPWEKISEIGRLKNLQFLRLQFCALDGEVWETRDEEFQQLRWLTLKSFYDLKEWRIESSSHFPKLGWLVLDDCMHLQEIPTALSDMTTLEVVEIKGNFEETLVESVRQIEQQQEEDGDENPKFQIHKVAGTTSETASSFFFTLFS